MTPLQDCKDKIDRTFQAAFGRGPLVEVDEAGKRLLIEGRWAIRQQGKGWVLICKHAVPDEVRRIKEITQPDDNPEFTFTFVWKAGRPIGVILHALMSQWAHTKTEEAILAVTGEGIYYGLDSDGDAGGKGAEPVAGADKGRGGKPRPGYGRNGRATA